MANVKPGDEVKIFIGSRSVLGEVSCVVGDKATISTPMEGLETVVRNLSELEKPGQKKDGKDLLYDDSAL